MIVDTENPVLDGYVGIDTLTEQIRMKNLHRGFEFNLMVVGGSGLGKSTLVNTIFKSKVSRKSCVEEDHGIPKTVSIQSISHVIEEKGICLKLTITDTPGFADQIDNSKCWLPIVKYINAQYELYMKEETSVKRRRCIPDTRVHCCIYFIPPSTHNLRKMDIEAMKELVKVVNVIPIIAKSDSMTLEEREYFRKQVQKDMKANGIRVYPDVEIDEENEPSEISEQEKKLNDKLLSTLPFAVVGSSVRHDVNGNKVLGRKTKWGIVEVENEEHCEFSALRDMIIRTNLQDLKEMTSQVHYEHYRHARLHPMKHLPLDDITSTPPSPIATPPPNCLHINPHSRRSTSNASRRTSSNFSTNVEPIPLRTSSSASSSGVSTPSKKVAALKAKKLAGTENGASPKKPEKAHVKVEN